MRHDLDALDSLPRRTRVHADHVVDDGEAEELARCQRDHGDDSWGADPWRWGDEVCAAEGLPVPDDMRAVR